MLILCNGMIRSGSTIQYNLVMSLVERRGIGEGIGFIDDEAKVTGETLERYAKSDQIFVAKSHHPLPQIKPFCERGEAVLCFTYRHLLDVAGSAKTKFDWPWEMVIAGINDGIKVHEMARSLPNSIIQEYEQFTSSLEAAVADLDHRLALGATAELRREIAEEYSIGKVIEKIETLRGAAKRRSLVKQSLKRLGLLPLAAKVNRILPDSMQYRTVIDSKTNLHHNHISAGQGRPGVSRLCLTPEETDDIINRFGSYLQEMGYDVTPTLAETACTTAP